MLEIAVQNRSGFRVDESAARAAIEHTLLAEGVRTGDVGVAFVEPAEMAALNARHRGREEPTDVLSFPIDGPAPLPAALPRQIGDVVVCPALAAAEGTALARLLVHGALHLLGYDHDADGGEMLAREAELEAEVMRVAAEPA
jgi:probable rRNA maturation factor